MQPMQGKCVSGAFDKNHCMPCRNVHNHVLFPLIITVSVKLLDYFLKILINYFKKFWRAPVGLLWLQKRSDFLGLIIILTYKKTLQYTFISWGTFYKKDFVIVMSRLWCLLLLRIARTQTYLCYHFRAKTPVNRHVCCYYLLHNHSFYINISRLYYLIQFYNERFVNISWWS